MEQGATQHYAAVVIGSGFGGTMTALPLAQEFQRRGKGEKTLILERGTWWTTPVGTVQDKEVKTYDFLVGKGQPTQFWSSAEHFRGFIDILTRCRRYKKNPDGLYDLTNFGKRGLFGLGLSQNDGVSILRACGVGGGHQSCQCPRGISTICPGPAMDSERPIAPLPRRPDRRRCRARAGKRHSQSVEDGAWGKSRTLFR